VKVARNNLGDGLVQDVHVQPHESKLYVNTYGPGDLQALRANESMRKAGGARDTEGLGRLALSIPPGHYMALIRANPDLNSPDAKVQTAAWRRFIASPESLPYRVRDKI